MRLSQLFRIINKKYIVRHFSLWNNMPSSNCSYLKNFANIDHLTGYKIIKKLHIEADDDAEISEMLVDTDHTDVELVKDALFKHSKDDVIQKLNNCASIEEALTVFHMQTVPYSIEHIAQTILVLVDIQTMFFHYSRPSQQARDKFINDLLANKEFTVFLKHVEDNVHTFPTNILSYVLYYLNKLGLKTDSSLIQSLAVELRDHLKLKLDVSHCAKLFKVIFAENSIRPYYISLPLIPSVINLIGRCQSVSELGHLTTCLNKLHNIVTRETLSRYKEEVHLFLREKRLNTKDSTLLKIIMFLNYPQWRNQNIVLISQCILTLKEDINSFRVNELLMIYEVFFKNQEPGEALNHLQRGVAQFLRKIDEGRNIGIEQHLMLFSAFIFFSSPINKMQYRKDIEHIFSDCNVENVNCHTLVTLRKIFSYIKISDKNICEKFWDLTLDIIKRETNVNNIWKLCQNYLQFNIDLAAFRHYEFEKWMNNFIKNKMFNCQFLTPSEIASYLTFMLVYGNNEKLMQAVLDRFEANIGQFKAADCLKVSYSLVAVKVNQNNISLQKYGKRIMKMLHDITENVLQYNENDYELNTALLKAAILRNDLDHQIIENMLVKFKQMDYMSSKILENICYIYLATDSLVPEAVNKCTEYIVNNHQNVIGFNAEKILYLCYYLAYYPINADKFLGVVIDTIIRDQERLSGLVFLQSALALCFFNKLPSSFIKQIFTVEFMDKLDAELASCYSRETYPQRVRNCLMQLNRAVCLEYPEYNVPWFHKKYVDEIERKYMIPESEIQFPLRIKDYLTEVAGNAGGVEDNVITPYGYHIDFVVSLDRNDQVVNSRSEDVNRRIAILLLRPYCYTRFYSHPKGKYQHKKRHLEMLGYEVSMVKFTEWINLLYAEERLEFLSDLIWPKKVENCTGNSRATKR
ncbi:unnamed protein product [Acanthoscelides obtectus]|uniref:RAP domain-containing protein n=2 Tax=Acanthoscelides obtectus TaxID=200917 RepID=A0A9P0KIB9_ACAOB|nr:unnamed protein product [Acanthoscelides obtectus]CAK1654693.1 FAST kinase domain-containing protein 1, mitochondrial [Acanthoscelides obtectus]